jgi:predicted exporter
VKPHPPGSIPKQPAERRRRWWIPLFWLLAALGCGWIVATTPVTADLSVFVPRGDPVADLLLEQLRNGPTTRLIPIGLTGDSEAARATVSRRLAERLRDSGQFARVANGADALPEAELQALFAHRYPLSPTVTPERFTAEGLRAALEQRLRELQSPLAILQKRWLPADPTGELLTLLRVWRGASANRPNGWACGSRPMARAPCCWPKPTPPATTWPASTRRWRRFARASPPPAWERHVELAMSGPGVLATLAKDQIRAEAELRSTLAMAAMILILIGFTDRRARSGPARCRCWPPCWPARRRWICCSAGCT